MSKPEDLFRLVVAVCLLMGIGAAGPLAKAQARPKDSRSSSGKVSAALYRGEGIFLQRCSTCHLRRSLKFGTPPTNGPALEGIFSSADAAEKARLKEFILKGSPGMPGFQYGLQPKDLDDLIAYLDTL